MGLISKLTAIADAIRTKLGTTDKMTMDEMATNIEAIPVGSDTWDRFVSGNMESLTLNVASIPDGFLGGYQGGLKSLKITNTATVPSGAFENIYYDSETQTTSVYEPQMVDVDFDHIIETVADYAFYAQTKIEKLANLSSLKEVGEYAFAFVGSQAVGTVEYLKTAYLANIAKLSQGSFKGCSLVQTVNNLAFLQSIPENCFDGCENLYNVVFNAAIGIGVNAFSGCKKLIGARFTKATKVEAYAFFEDSSLKSVYLPACTDIGDCAFKDALTANADFATVKIKSIGASCFENCGAAELSLSDGLTYDTVDVGARAFSHCENLEVVGLAFAQIPSYCFQGSHILTDIYITNANSVVKFEGTGWFTECYRLFGIYDATYNPSSAKGAVHVPPNLLDAYKADKDWINNFIGDGGEIVAIE